MNKEYFINKYIFYFVLFRRIGIPNEIIHIIVEDIIPYGNTLKLLLLLGENIRFEYKILDAAVIEPDLTKSDFPHIHFEEAREKMLNQYGKKGWELVTIDTHPNNGIKYIFKRDLK